MKSKFFNIRSKKTNTVDQTDEQTAFTEAELDELLATVEDNVEVVKEESVSSVEEAIKEPVKQDKVIKSKKAYNVYQDSTTKMYMMDIIEYGEEGFSVVTKQLTLSQPMAMYAIKKVFTDKLILKKGE